MRIKKVITENTSYETEQSDALSDQINLLSAKYNAITKDSVLDVIKTKYNIETGSYSSDMDAAVHEKVAQKARLFSEIKRLIEERAKLKHYSADEIVKNTAMYEDVALSHLLSLPKSSSIMIQDNVLMSIKSFQAILDTSIKLLESEHSDFNQKIEAQRNHIRDLEQTVADLEHNLNTVNENIDKKNNEVLSFSLSCAKLGVDVDVATSSQGSGLANTLEVLKEEKRSLETKIQEAQSAINEANAEIDKHTAARIKSVAACNHYRDTLGMLNPNASLEQQAIVEAMLPMNQANKTFIEGLGHAPAQAGVKTAKGTTPVTITLEMPIECMIRASQTVNTNGTVVLNTNFFENFYQNDWLTPLSQLHAETYKQGGFAPACSSVANTRWKEINAMPEDSLAALNTKVEAMSMFLAAISAAIESMKEPGTFGKVHEGRLRNTTGISFSGHDSVKTMFEDMKKVLVSISDTARETTLPGLVEKANVAAEAEARVIAEAAAKAEAEAKARAGTAVSDSDSEAHVATETSKNAGNSLQSTIEAIVSHPYFFPAALGLGVVGVATAVGVTPSSIWSSSSTGQDNDPSEVFNPVP